MTWISLQLVIGANKNPDLGLCREKRKCVWHDTNDIASLIVEPNRAADYAFLRPESVFPKGIRENYYTSARQILRSERPTERWRHSQKERSRVWPEPDEFPWRVQSQSR